MTESKQSTEGMTRADFEARLIARAWQDENFKQELLSNPKAVYAKEIGQEIPDGITIQVLEENPNTIYLVIPRKPELANAEAELSDEALEAVAGGCMAPSFLFW